MHYLCPGTWRDNVRGALWMYATLFLCYTYVLQTVEIQNSSMKCLKLFICIRISNLVRTILSNAGNPPFHRSY